MPPVVADDLPTVIDPSAVALVTQIAIAATARRLMTTMPPLVVRSEVRLGPRSSKKLVRGHRIDHPARVQSGLLSALAAVALPFQLPRCVRVGVDREDAVALHGELEQAHRWVEPLRAGVDLHGD